MKKGFTLLELLVSSIILAIGILGLAALFPAAMRSTLLTRQNTQAVEICQATIEYLRTLPITSEELEEGTHGPDTIDSKFVRTYTVTDNHPATNMKFVEVTVSWQQVGGSGGLNHSQTMKTYISK